jgi:hypothetical protein
MKKIAWVFLLCGLFVFAKAEYHSFWKPIEAVSDSLLIQIEQARPHQVDSYKEKIMIAELYHRADSLQHPVLLSRAMFCDAWNQLAFNIDSTAVLLRKAALLPDAALYPYDLARINYLWGSVFQYKADFLNAYIAYQKQLPYFKKIEDNVFIANTLVNIGNIFYELKEYQLALSYLKEANIYYEKTDMPLSSKKNKLNISNVLYDIGQKQAAADTLKLLLDDLTFQQDTAFRINILSTFAQSADIQDREKYFREAYALARQYQNNYLLTKVLINHADFHRTKHQLDSALIYAREAMSLSLSQNDQTTYRFICGNMALIHAGYQQWDSAYHYSTLYHIYTDSILHSDKIKEIYKMQTREAIQLYEIELEHTQKEAKLQQKIALSVLLGLFCLFVSLFIIVRLRGKKTKVEKQLKEAENKELNERLKSEQLQKENLQLEIDSQNREMASNTLLLSEKNRILVHLEKQINEMGNSGTLPAKEEKELKKQIQTHLQGANEWEYFKLHFEKVHPGFFSQLKAIYPAFSENELRLCAYIRIGMSAKQLSQILLVLPETINTARYRLRKKLALTPEVSLEDFLRSI